MTINIIEQYLELTKKQINTYMKMVLGREYNQKYCDMFVQKYINVRYYNFYENDVNNTVRKKILFYLKQTEEDLIINNINDREIIENTRLFFYYNMYFDKVISYKDFDKLIDKIKKLREKVLNIFEDDFEKNISYEMKSFMEQKENLLNKFKSDVFSIKISNYSKSNIYRVNIKNNIKFPEIYSEFIINKAFNIGLINEDKLVVEYYLTTIKVIDDIIKSNFKKQYIVEFADTLLEKSKKLKSLLNCLNNSIIQDKITLKIKYENLEKNKEVIYELMKNGYKFAIILDNSFESDYKNIEMLKMFKFVLVSEDLECYKDIMSNKKILKNIIEI